MDLSVSNLSQRLLIAWKPFHILYLHGLVSGVPPLQTLSLSCPVPGRLREQIRQWPRRGMLRHAEEQRKIAWKFGEDQGPRKNPG